MVALCAACLLPPCDVGTLGTLGGGRLLDAIGSSMRNALLLCCIGITSGACLAAASFWASSFEGFAALFALAELLMFGSQVRSQSEAPS